MKVTANAARAGTWWAISVPEVPGVFTQAKRLDHVAAMAADAVALVTGKPAGSVEVTVKPQIPFEVTSHLERARQLREEAAQANTDSAKEMRVAAQALASLGLPLRDIGAILGVSYQRAHQLLVSAA
jgi:predicted RNase H-like HicB family nuclease